VRRLPPSHFRQRKREKKINNNKITIKHVPEIENEKIGKLTII
jgi:hypothetical protein